MLGRQTQKAGGRRWGLLIALAALVAALAVGALQLWSTVSADARDQAATSVRQAILDAAMQCCAIEGSYPQTLEYLEEHYGLVVNDRDYAITYEVFASNVVPSVAVVPR